MAECSHVSPEIKKGAPTRETAPGTPTKGHERTALGRRPQFGGAVQALLLSFKSPMTQVGRFPWKQNLTLARQFQIVITILRWYPGRRQ
jgi:hypothetical protein